jgi:hypothetical protein
MAEIPVSTVYGNGCRVFDFEEFGALGQLEDRAVAALCHGYRIVSDWVAALPNGTAHATFPEDLMRAVRQAMQRDLRGCSPISLLLLSEAGIVSMEAIRGRGLIATMKRRFGRKGVGADG